MVIDDLIKDAPFFAYMKEHLRIYIESGYVFYKHTLLSQTQITTVPVPEDLYTTLFLRLPEQKGVLASISINPKEDIREYRKSSLRRVRQLGPLEIAYDPIAGDPLNYRIERKKAGDLRKYDLEGRVYLDLSKE